MTHKSVKSKRQAKRTDGRKPLQHSRSATRGHAHAIPFFDTRPERIAYLLDLMLDGRFTWDTCASAARVWGVDPSTVRACSAEARRHYLREVDRHGREDYRARLLATLESIGRSALERTEEVIDSYGDKHTIRKPDQRTARQVVMDLAQLGGLITHKHEVTVSELTDEEIRAQLRSHGLEVRTIETTAELVLGQGEKQHDASTSDGGDGTDSERAPASEPD